MQNKKVLLITEANDFVASGHLFECAELAKLLRKAGIHVDIAVNDDANDSFKQRLDGPYLEYHKNVEIDHVFFVNQLQSERYSILVTNLREVHDEWISWIRKVCNAVIICIDEWGHRFLGCDVIINPMIDPYFWEYKGSKAKLYTGQAYLILPEKIAEYHKREKNISKKITRVCVSMGGVDKYGSTVKIVKWILGQHQEVQHDVILGGGFKYQENLDSIIKGNSNINMMQNIKNIYDYFEKADLAFCAGGNTLHELACIGTPAIVVPTMPHEFNNGKKFEEWGFGIVLSQADNISNDEFTKAWNLISEENKRRDMMLAGKKICTGTGGELIMNLIMRCLSEK